MKWVFIVAALAALAVISALCLDVTHECGRHARFTTLRPTRGVCGSAPWPARTCLKELSMAQLEFRKADADKDGKANFWRADIAGLYALAPGGGPAIKLAPLWIAFADDRPVVSLSEYGVPSAHGGYWYRAIRHAGEDPQALDPNRFAFCAYPDSPASGKYIYVCDDRFTVYRAPANGRRGIDVFPTEEELKSQWTILD